MTWVKICGMTNLEDALVAVDAGADAVGFVFYETSPRCVTLEKAREICAQLPETVGKVGVFVNEREDVICSAVDETGVSAVQMHGDREDPQVADRIVQRHPEMRVLAAISMGREDAQAQAKRWNPKSVEAFLLDSGTSAKHGGTGMAFDWKVAAAGVSDMKKMGKIIAAGGLTAENVIEAMEILKPWGVDVVSGVEASPGKKDPEKVRAFVKAVRDFDRKVVG